MSLWTKYATEFRFKFLILPNVKWLKLRLLLALATEKQCQSLGVLWKVDYAEPKDWSRIHTLQAVTEFIWNTRKDFIVFRTLKGFERGGQQGLFLQ